MDIHPVARFHSPFPSKFGIPKQSGLVEELEGTVVFEPRYRNADALRVSSVRLSHVEWATARGPIIHVLGADLMDGTPIYDIKPYVAYADCHAGARSGFVDTTPVRRLQVDIPPAVAASFSARQLAALRKTLELDPRPHYQQSPTRVYGMPFEGRDIHFRVSADGLLTVLE